MYLLSLDRHPTWDLPPFNIIEKIFKAGLSDTIGSTGSTLSPAKLFPKSMSTPLIGNYFLTHRKLDPDPKPNFIVTLSRTCIPHNFDWDFPMIRTILCPDHVSLIIQWDFPMHRT